MRGAVTKNVKLIVSPELAPTTFFTGYVIEKQEDVDKSFEPASPEKPYAIIQSPNGKPLFNKATELGLDVYIGFCEWWTAEGGKVSYYNTAIYSPVIQRRGLAKYRKVHLPGRHEPDTRPGVTQKLEKRPSSLGDLGFEAFRVADLAVGSLKSKDATTTGGRRAVVIRFSACCPAMAGGRSRARDHTAYRLLSLC